MMLNIQKEQNKEPEYYSNVSFMSTDQSPGAKKGFIKGEDLRLLRTNSSKATV